MTKATRLSARIPFSGFYETAHSDNIDQEIESYFDVKGDGKNHVPEEFYWSFNKHHAIQIEYVQLYVRAFSEFFEGATGIALPLEFEEMTSPREYNFETDKAFCSVPLKTVRAIRAYIPENILAKQIIVNHRSRDGFCSFYSEDIETWLRKPLKTWDHNELHTLIEAALSFADVNLDDFKIMENALCNGRISNIVYPYVSAWIEEHPLDAIGKAIKDFFDIPDTLWKAMSENEQQTKADEYAKHTYHCSETFELPLIK